MTCASHRTTARHGGSHGKQPNRPAHLSSYDKAALHTEAVPPTDPMGCPAPPSNSPTDPPASPAKPLTPPAAAAQEPPTAHPLSRCAPLALPRPTHHGLAPPPTADPLEERPAQRVIYVHGPPANPKSESTTYASECVGRKALTQALPMVNKKKKPQVRGLTWGSSWSRLSGFEPETYALRDRERSCCVVPGRATE